MLFNALGRMPISDFTFPPPPVTGAAEWRGTPIGTTNVITRTKGRTPRHDKTLDQDRKKRDRLMAKAAILVKSIKGVLRHDVVVHGIRVRCFTNSQHLHDFWVRNWFSPGEWVTATGRAIPSKPQILVYALCGVADEPEAAYYSRQRNTIVFFNTAYYGQLKSWVLGAVGRVLAEEYGIHSIHGACVAQGEDGSLFIAPTGTGKSTSSYGLMNISNTRFHSDDWVYIRYALQSKKGLLFTPTFVKDNGREIRGYQVFRWLEENPHKGEAIVKGITLRNDEVALTVEDIDSDYPLQAHAYISEKLFYLRSNIVESFPGCFYELVESKFENVPDIGSGFVQKHNGTLESLARELTGYDQVKASRYSGERSEDGLKILLARMFAFDNARAMLNISQVFTESRVYTDPLEPLKLANVFLLRRDPGDKTLVERLSRGRFITRLLIGQTPEGKFETAFNAYRAVDDGEERAFVDELRRAGEKSDDPTADLYHLFQSRTDIPQTLEEEFELFRLLYNITRCYDVNTILAMHPDVKGRREAVVHTMRLITKIIDERPEHLVLSVDNYKDYLRKL